ncbi:MAG: hypothetical protein ACK4RK_17795 [Gemmataceae bacterium]
MSRGRRKNPGQSESLDSFLDIVTNSLGLLILVSTLSTLSSTDTLSQFRLNLGAPIIVTSDRNLKPVFIECRDNRIIPMDVDSLTPELRDKFDFFLPLAEKQKNAQAFNARKFSTTTHVIELRPREFNVQVVFKPLNQAVGYALPDVKDPKGSFSAYLNKWGTDDHYLNFYVRSDSFEAFREARALAKEQGFDLSWHPLKKEDELSLYYGRGGGGGTPIDK